MDLPIDINNPHDSFVKFIFSKIDRAIDFFKNYLPLPLIKEILWDTLTLESPDFVESHMKQSHSDLLFKVQTRSGELLYLLVDHKSHLDQNVGYQLYGYVGRIWERHRRNHEGLKLPPIFCMVLYHGTHSWNVKPGLEPLLQCHQDILPYMPSIPYMVIDLSRMSGNEFRGKADLIANLMLMRDVGQGANLLKQIPVYLEKLREVRNHHDYLENLQGMMVYLWKHLKQEDYEEVKRMIQAELTEEGEPAMASIADMFIEKGIERGREEERKKLEEERKKLANAVIKILQSKIENIPESIQEKIISIQDSSILDKLIDLAIYAGSLDQFKQKMDELLSLRK